MTTLPVSSIVVGDVRKDMGDLGGLAKSIEEKGLRRPIVVRPDCTLIAGRRRLEAVRMLKRDEIPVTIVDVVDLLRAERANERRRQNWLPSEAVAIGKLMEDEVRPRAVERQRLGGLQGASNPRDGRGLFVKGHGDSTSKNGPQTRDIVAAALGMGMGKYVQARAVVAAAEAEPERFEDLVTEMDETGNVRGTYREMGRRRSLGLTGPTLAPVTESEAVAPVKPGKEFRHPIHYKKRHRDQTRELERGIWQIDAATQVLVTVDPTAVDASQVADWLTDLEEARRRIGAVIKGLKNVEK